MPITKLAVVSFFALSASTSLSYAANIVKLLPHRAIYEVKLIEADERSGVDAMSGKMVYEFTGGACKGYKTDFRFVTTVEGGGNTQVSDQRTKTFEDPDGRTLVFSTQTLTDEKLDSDLEGVAERKDGKVSVAIDKPEGKDVQLGDAVFPVQHVEEILDHARRNDRMTEQRIFDASDEADEIMVASTLIGPQAKPKTGDAELALLGSSAGRRFWPVTTTYHKTPLQNDSLPEYQMSMILHENGITRDLTMRYTGFSLKGTLTSFEPLPLENCQ